MKKGLLAITLLTSLICLMTIQGSAGEKSKQSLLEVHLGNLKQAGLEMGYNILFRGALEKRLKEDFSGTVADFPLEKIRALNELHDITYQTDKRIDYYQARYADAYNEIHSLKRREVR